VQVCWLLATLLCSWSEGASWSPCTVGTTRVACRPGVVGTRRIGKGRATHGWREFVGGSFDLRAWGGRHAAGVGGRGQQRLFGPGPIPLGRRRSIDGWTMAMVIEASGERRDGRQSRSRPFWRRAGCEVVDPSGGIHRRRGRAVAVGTKHDRSLFEASRRGRSALLFSITL